MGAYANNYKQKVYGIVDKLYPEDFEQPKNFDAITKLQSIALLQLIGEELAHVNDNLTNIATYLSKNRK